MTAQDWKKYGKHLVKHTRCGDEQRRCPVCGREITHGEAGVGYLKNSAGEHVFFHDRCVSPHLSR